MAQYEDDVPVPPRVATPLSSGAVTAARVQALGPGTIRVKATVANVAPPDFEGGILCQGGYAAGLESDTALSVHFPGVIAPGGTGWLWGWTESTGMTASVSHA